MAKDTFYNLNEEKQDRIFKVLKDEFESKPFNEVTVKSIVEKLSIARGSFYQYFTTLRRLISMSYMRKLLIFTLSL